MIDREAIKTMLQRVQAGELTHEQATAELMGQADYVLTSPDEARSTSEQTSGQNCEQPQPVAELIEQLGTPPTEVVDQWCETLASWIASGDGSADPNRHTVERFCRDDLQRIGVNHLGQLVRIDQQFCVAAADPDSIVQSFREAMGVDQSYPLESSPTPSEIVSVNPVEELVKDNQTKINPKQKTGHAEKASDEAKPVGKPDRAKSMWSNIAIAAGIILCLGTIATMMFRHLGGNPEQTEAVAQSKDSNRGDNVFTDLASGKTETVAREKPIQSSSRDTVESLERIGGPQMDSVEIASQENLANSLGDFTPSAIASMSRGTSGPSASGPSASGPNAANSDAPEKTPLGLGAMFPDLGELSKTVPEGEATDGLSEEDLSEDERKAMGQPLTELDGEQMSLAPTSFPDADQQTAEPDEMEQDTETATELANDSDADGSGGDDSDGDESVDGGDSQVSGIVHTSLPPLDDTEEIILIDDWTNRASDLRWQFPTDSTVEIQPSAQQDEDAWRIFDSSRSETLASIRSDNGTLKFGWKDEANKIQAAKSMLQGRLQWTEAGNQNRTLYLRPLIVAEPWRFDLQSHDVRPTWDLGWAMPPNVSMMSVEMDLPDDIEMTWIEPLDTKKFRKQEGVAVLKATDTETVDLRVWLDIRCSRKLSCRVRYAGRLDATMPWQGVSRDLLNQFADQVANYSQLISREAERLQNVYDIVGSRGKRIIKFKQKRNDALAEQVRQVAKRVAELQSLIATVEAEATLRFRLSVDWPSGEEQVVFVTEQP